VSTDFPLFFDDDFYDLLEKIGFNFIKDDFRPGETVHYSFGDVYNENTIDLLIESHAKERAANITIGGRTLNLNISLKFNKDKNWYQVDDASIYDFSNPDDTVTHSIPFQDDEHSRQLLPPFLKEMANAAQAIMFMSSQPKDKVPTPAEFETEIFKTLKPIIDIKEELEAEIVTLHAHDQTRVSGAGMPPP
jgi:hypothetical protein